MTANFFKLLAALLFFQSMASAGESKVVNGWLAAQADLKSLKADFRQERVLRKGRRPIVSEGEFAYAAPGSIRWQLGEPVMTLAVQKAKGDLVVANVKRKSAKVYPLKVLKQEEAAMGFSFIEAGFPRTQKEFDKNFTITGEELVDGVHHLTVKFNDKPAAVVVRKMVFYIDPTSFELRGFYLRFRDSSSITTTFDSVKKNPAIPDSEFEFDLDGYKTETQE